MDELERRRLLKTDPNNFITALSDEELSKLSDEEVTELRRQKQFEKRLEAAFDIEVPEDLADRIILSNRIKNKKSRWQYFSLAATITLVIFASLFIPTNSDLSLSAQALAHVEHEAKYLSYENKISPEELKRRLEKMGFKLAALPKDIAMAMRCGLGGKDAMHIIARINNRPVSLLMTHQQSPSENSFSDDKRVGKYVSIGDAGVFVIAENFNLVDSFIHQLRGT